MPCWLARRQGMRQSKQGKLILLFRGPACKHMQQPQGNVSRERLRTIRASMSSIAAK